MSVTRSLITGMFPIGSTTISTCPSAAPSGASAAPAPASPAAAPGREAEEAADDVLSAQSWASPIWVLQARPDWPLIFIPHDPQIAARHEQRTDSEPSSRSLAWRRPSSTDSVGSRSTSKLSQYGPSPDSGWKRRTLSV
jgi:hypothetical protein